MRGLIEKTTSPTDGRGSYYQITTEFLQHLGITSVADLPDFAQLVTSLKLPETPATATTPPNP
jgi:chromosome segregation and condensation protein ScpB